jgi:hypothetical protein
MSVSLTIYNQGTALVRDQRTFTLAQGENTVDFTDVASTIDRTSVTVKSTPDADAVRVLEQSYLYDLVGLSGLLRRYTDSRIVVTMDDGATHAGALLTGQGMEHQNPPDIILRRDDGEVTVVREGVRDIRFPKLPDGLRTRPTLRWILDSASAGDHTLDLTYLADGMRWSADYNLLLGAANDTLDLVGWVTLTNESGAAFHDAQIKLIAGDVARIQPDDDAPDWLVERKQSFAARAAPEAVQQRDMFEYQLYEISRRVSLENNETKQVEFLQRSGVPAKVAYESDSALRFGRYGRAPFTAADVSPGENRIDVYVTFSTGKENGLGADMPAGRVRVFQNDTDGSAALIGEMHLNHTPEGEDVRLKVGQAFDLVRERKQTQFKLLSHTEMTESFEILLRNRKDTAAVDIRVIEHLFRWSNWSIEAASHPYERENAGTIVFPVTVPPQGETVITYTVRYSFPPIEK